MGKFIIFLYKDIQIIQQNSCAEFEYSIGVSAGDNFAPADSYPVSGAINCLETVVERTIFHIQFGGIVKPGIFAQVIGSQIIKIPVFPDVPRRIFDGGRFLFSFDPDTAVSEGVALNGGFSGIFKTAVDDVEAGGIHIIGPELQLMVSAAEGDAGKSAGPSGAVDHSSFGSIIQQNGFAFSAQNKRIAEDQCAGQTVSPGGNKNLLSAFGRAVQSVFDKGGLEGFLESRRIIMLAVPSGAEITDIDPVDRQG